MDAPKSPSLTLDRSQVMKILPHRPPMLFIDTASCLIPGLEVVAHFHVEPSMAIFAGHFPGEAIFPGVCTVESVAQAAGLLMMATSRYVGKLPLFISIQNAVFRKKILPGDVLDIHVTLLEERQDKAIVSCRGKVFVSNILCAEADVQLAFR